MGTNFKEIIDSIIQQYLDDLATLISINSVRDESTMALNQPFGLGVRKAMDEFGNIAKRLGFEVHDEDGYAIDARLGDGVDYLGILGHLDVVDISYPALWESDPFVMDIREGVVYGRGVNDDKGPLLLTLYAIKMLKDLGYQQKLPIRVIAGGDEESNWECVDYYFKKQAQPLMAFSPDGNFPVVNGEKGILQFDLILDYDGTSRISSLNSPHTICDHFIVESELGTQEVLGKSALSRNPQRAQNAIFKYIIENQIPNDLKEVFGFVKNYLMDITGKDLGLYSVDDEMGETTIALTHMFTQDKQIVLKCDYRYPKTMNKESAIEILSQFNQVQIELSREYLYVDPNDRLIQDCLSAYEVVTGKKETPITKGGASYARALKKGIAFGATLEGDDPRPHMPNEKMSIESMKIALEIYLHAIKKLAYE